MSLSSDLVLKYKGTLKKNYQEIHWLTTWTTTLSWDITEPGQSCNLKTFWHVLFFVNPTPIHAKYHFYQFNYHLYRHVRDVMKYAKIQAIFKAIMKVSIMQFKQNVIWCRKYTPTFIIHCKTSFPSHFRYCLVESWQHVIYDVNLAHFVKCYFSTVNVTIPSDAAYFGCGYRSARDGPQKSDSIQPNLTSEFILWVGQGFLWVLILESA